MTRLNIWTIAFPVSAITAFALLCLTVIRFQDGTLHIYFEAPGGIKLEAGVEK
jgi:hypothetical protein